MTVTPAVTPQKRHQTGKVTLATVEAALATLGVNASMRAVQRVTGGSFRDVCAVVNLVRGRASVTVQEALAAGDPKDFGHTLVETLRAIERSISETRAIQARQDEQLAALQRAAEGYRTRRHDDRLLDALDQLHLDLAAIRPDLTKAAAKTASKDPMAMRSLLAGLEARLLEAIAESRGATAAPAELPAPVPLPDPDLLLHLQAAHAGVLSSLTQIHADQRELASAVSALHRELAHVHGHLASLRSDVAALQAGVGAATERLVQASRAQGASMRRTLRDLGLTQLRAAATTAAALSQAVRTLRRQPATSGRPTPKARPVGQRPVAPVRRSVKSTRPAQKPATTRAGRSTNQRRTTAAGRAQPARPSRTSRTVSVTSPRRAPAKKRLRR